MSKKLPGRWPKVLVLPEPQHFIRGYLEQEYDCGTVGCLVGWANTAFDVPIQTNFDDVTDDGDYALGFVDLENRSECAEKLRARDHFLAEVIKAAATDPEIPACAKILGEDLHKSVIEMKAIQVNDTTIRFGEDSFVCPSDGQKAIARCWRKAAEKCGYDVSHPVVIK